VEPESVRDDEDMEANPGDVVRVRKGPFQGFEGVVADRLNDDAALVILDIFGRTAKAELPLRYLEDDAPGSGGAGVREPRRPLPPDDSGVATLSDEESSNGSITG
jgi:hypothetical protein